MRWTLTLALISSCSAAREPSTSEPPQPPPSTSSFATSTPPGTPFCQSATAQQDLERLAECVRRAVGILDAEPKDEADLATFVSRPLHTNHPERGSYADRCAWLDQASLAGLRLSKRTTDWDHFDDGSASAHIELRFTCSDELEATSSIELRVGGPE